MQGALPNLLEVPTASKRGDRPCAVYTTKRQSDEPLSPLVTVSENGTVDHDVVLDYTLASLEGMQTDLAKTITLALRLQLDGLTTSLKQLGEEESKMQPQTPQASPRLTSEAFAAAIKASLEPKFDSLDKGTSDLAQQIPVSAREASILDCTASPQIAASVADELVPEITATIDNIFSARLSDVKQSEASLAKGNARPRVQIDIRSHSKDSYSSSHMDGKTESDMHGKGLSLPLGLKRQGSSSSLVGTTTRHSDIQRNKQPERAFVVNFRRLVEIQKVLSLIHLIIKSTAIATLTLVSCGFWTDFVFSVLFVGSVLGIYAVHEIRHDGMDIEDYKALSGLMEDDNGTYRGSNGEPIEVQNPNRLLKALSLSKNFQRRRRSGITIICLTVFILVMWAGIFFAWATTDSDEGTHLRFLYEDEVAVMATQMLIGTVMLLFHGVFEWLYWRETQCVMPTMPGDRGQRSWDPRATADGVPRQYLWFGLPSMWFTSREAYDDLRLWITYSCKHSNHIVTKIHPEELALFALKPEGAGYVRRTLDDAKLFSIGKWEFFKRDKRGVPKPVQNGEEPEKLGMSFVFFDRASEQFLQPEEDYQSGMMRLLTRTLSDMEDDAAEV
mmetsp:Transcript_111666/g.175921  ORF Transcript_111666/g.175921 Transcript_111666/m.175921 type:complete len:614 (+) Transcript_111666:35-1876(+)